MQSLSPSQAGPSTDTVFGRRKFDASTSVIKYIKKMRVSSLVYSWLGLTSPDAFPSTSSSLNVFSPNASSLHLQSRATTWTSLGCVTDGSARALTGSHTTSSSLTTESCQAFCASAGYSYAGTEYSQECYCGNSLSNGLGVSTSSSNCNMACTGNSGETCGGNFVLNLYQATTSSSTPITWSSVGCVQDGSARALTGSHVTSSSLTTESCQALCAGAGYLYAGTEYSQECYCGNALSNGLGGTISSSNCNMACSGNSGETCGGNFALSLYKASGTTGGSSSSSSSSTSSSAAPTTTSSSGWTSLGCYSDASTRALAGPSTQTTSMTIEYCQSFCSAAGYAYAGVEYSQQCMCDSAIRTGSGQGVLATDGRCNMACAGNSGETCGGNFAINIYKSSGTVSPATTTTATTTTTTSAAPTATSSTGWSTLGCYSDASSRALAGPSTQTTSMTIEYCQNFCVTQGYVYAGVEYSQQCMCDSAIRTGSGQGVLATDGRCNMACAGNSGETCGGNFAINIYKYAGNPSTVTTSAAPTTSASSGQTWVSLGCRVDVSARALTSASTTSSSMTIEVCQSFCSGKGYPMAGVENGNECYCGSSFSNNGGGQAASTDCSTSCAGNSNEICGGGWRMNVYTLSTAASVTSLASSTSTTSTSTTSSSAPVSTVGLSTNKVVVAHHIVGNTYPYTQATWAADIAAAQAAGIDAFALNYGTDSWEPAQIASAYAAASSTGFKLFLSADMTSLPSGGSGDAQSLANQVRLYAGHPAQLYYNGGLVLSTFSGENSYFGQGSVNAGWQSVINMIGVQVTFIPSFFVDPSTFGNYPVISGTFNWNGGWPSGNSAVSYSTDQQWLNGLNGKLYMAAVSPNFFTHYGYKNFLYKNDDNLFATRWEMLIANRNQIAMTEIISWNDYGESHYIGPIEGAMPDGTNWVNGFPHTAWLDMNSYYAYAFKYGSYPPIPQDKVYIYARPHTAGAGACCDSVGQPTGYNWEVDNFYVVVLASSAGSLILSTPPSGSGASPTSSNANPTTVNVNAGVNKFSHALAVGSGMRATLYRNGQQVVDVNPSDYKFINNPQTLNYNVYVAMGHS